jgi:predicted transcriptional regulator
MNRKLEALLEIVSTWPDAALDELIKSVVEIEARDTGVYRLNDDEKAAIEAALASAERGEFASDEEVAALFNRYRD